MRGLPDEARDINFHLRGAFGPFTCYDFHISEPAFLKWVSENGWDVKPSSAFQFQRLNPKTERLEYVDITEGFEHRDQFDHDSFRVIAFDRANQRAYYWYSAR